MMQASNNILKNIEHFGERYCEKHLGDWDKKKLENDWWEALKFFFSHSFMRGRRDKLSNEYCYFTIKVLEDHFEIPKGKDITEKKLEESYEKLKKDKDYFDKDPILKFKKDKNIGRGNSIKHNDFNKDENNPIVNLLIKDEKVEVEWNGGIYQKEIFLGNDEDVMMVLDVLKFISEDEKKNIYNYLKDMLKKDKVEDEDAYRELTKLRAIGDKIATFVLRDIGLLNPEIKIADEDYKRAFPVDTWVTQIAQKLGCKSIKEKDIKNYLINNCKEFSIDPSKFAAGSWFLGFHSLDILIEDCLGKVECGQSALPNNK